MQIHLKVKALSLAEESRIIRAQEQRLARRIRKAAARGKPLSAASVDRIQVQRHSLRQHRKEDVRREARATHLARGFLKGRLYRQIEYSVRPDKDIYFAPWGRVADLVAKYGDVDKRVAAQRIAEWIDTPLPPEMAEWREGQRKEAALSRQLRREEAAAKYADRRRSQAA